MIIRHMQGTFGTLDGEQLRLDTGLNIIYAPNESGKSTWCAFLRAMLYGIDTSQRARAGFVPDKQKYAPWSGKPMAGELELEQGGKCITIRRWTETPGAPLRGFSAVYTGTDIPVPGLTATDAGEQLTGVSAEVFARSAFIGQGGLVVTGTPELERRISAIVTSGEEASSYTEADAQLRAWLRRRRSGQHGALPELEQRIADTETQLHRLERNAQEHHVTLPLRLAAGLDGIEHRMILQEPVNKNLFRPDEAEGLGLEMLPASLEEAVQAAQESEFLRSVLPEELSHRYYEEELKRCAALKNAADPAEYERIHYFNAI